MPVWVAWAVQAPTVQAVGVAGLERRAARVGTAGTES